MDLIDLMGFHHISITNKNASEICGILVKNRSVTTDFMGCSWLFFWFLGEKYCKTMTNDWILEMGQNVQTPTVWFNYNILKISQNHQICWPIGAQMLAQSQFVVEYDMSEITSPQTNQTYQWGILLGSPSLKNKWINSFEGFHRETLLLGLVLRRKEWVAGNPPILRAEKRNIL